MASIRCLQSGNNYYATYYLGSIDLSIDNEGKHIQFQHSGRFYKSPHEVPVLKQLRLPKYIQKLFQGAQISFVVSNKYNGVIRRYSIENVLNQKIFKNISCTDIILINDDMNIIMPIYEENTTETLIPQLNNTFSIHCALNIHVKLGLYIFKIGDHYYYIKKTSHNIMLKEYGRMKYINEYDGVIYSFVLCNPVTKKCMYLQPDKEKGEVLELTTNIMAAHFDANVIVFDTLCYDKDLDNNYFKTYKELQFKLSYKFHKKETIVYSSGKYLFTEMHARHGIVIEHSWPLAKKTKQAYSD